MNGKWKWLLFISITVMVTVISVQSMSKTITVLSENSIPDRQTCIVIDPGHGGEDGGAVSLTGRSESVFNLEISLRLQDFIHIMGYRTKLTRNSDVSIYTKGDTLSQKKISDLKERVRIINETEGAFVLSIHQNSFPDHRYSGAQVFYPDEGSKEFAVQLQSALVSHMNPASNRKAKKSSGVYIMEHIRCPGVLIECGFLSNAAEEALLTQGEYQKKLACVIAANICQYLSHA